MFEHWTIWHSLGTIFAAVASTALYKAVVPGFMEGVGGDLWTWIKNSTLFGWFGRLFPDQPKKRKKLNSFQIGMKVQELIDFKKQVTPIIKEVKSLRKGFLECQLEKVECRAYLKALRTEFEQFKKEKAS